MTILRTAAVALSFLAVATVRSAEPAARLMPAKPLAETSRAVIGRGSTPDFRSFDPSRPIAPPELTANSPAPPKDEGLRLRPLTPPQQQASVPQKPGFVTNTWNDVKEFVVGKPSPTPPRSYPQQPGLPSYIDPAALRPTTTLATASAVPGMYAGSPAYRWYGWGTTTPGGNAYAPAGQYPRGSANWYAQTGATPGAFPVPVMNPMRPLPGAEPPMYVGIAPAPTYPTPTFAAPTFSPPMSGTVELIPAPFVDEQPGTAVPTLMVPSGPAIPVGPPIIIQSSATEPKPVPTVNWQPASEEPVRFAAVGDAKPAAPKTLTLAQVIQAACPEKATVTGVRPTGAKKLLIRLTATTEANACAAAEAISRLPDLKQYEVGFEASVTGR